MLWLSPNGTASLQHVSSCVMRRVSVFWRLRGYSNIVLIDLLLGGLDGSVAIKLVVEGLILQARRIKCQFVQMILLLLRKTCPMNKYVLLLRMSFDIAT